MTIKERLVTIETELRYIKRMLYLIVVGVLGSTGLQVL